jgi:hypothetical protein
MNLSQLRFDIRCIFAVITRDVDIDLRDEHG